jgi:DNA-binding Lrp family transcriptional regulator
MPDALDRRIVDVLHRDGRASVPEIAERAGTVPTTVQKRLRALEEKGVISGYRPRLDYAALGYGLTALFRLSVRGDALDAVVEQLRARGEIVDCYVVTGPPNVFAVGKFADCAALNGLAAELVTDPSVEVVATDIVAGVVREDGPIDLRGE